MSETQKRISSAALLILMLLAGIVLGRYYFYALALLVMCLATHELHCNFFKKSPFTFDYFLNLFIILFTYSPFFFPTLRPHLYLNLIWPGAIFHLVLLVLLFAVKKDHPIFCKAKDLIVFSGPFFLIPAVSLGVIISMPKWGPSLALLLLVNFSMDTGAWLFGKFLGKHKLYEKISPKKTIEGLIGGMFLATLLGGIFWNWKISPIKGNILFLLALLSVLSQMGDLIQSQFKRIFHLKDSSNLIPGHGGVYDRVDGLVYISPFFALVVYYYSPT